MGPSAPRAPPTSRRRWTSRGSNKDELSLTTFQNHWNAGLKVCALFSGPYQKSDTGILNITASSWAAGTLNWYSANCTVANTPWIELLNEPYGFWFWGNNAMAQTHCDRYALIVKATYDAFAAHYGAANMPGILIAYEESGWGTKVKNSSAVSNVLQYVTGVTAHSYGGAAGSNVGGANGDRNKVIFCHNDSGKPVFITEMGWPTAVTADGGNGIRTGDSQQWTEAQQAANIGSFCDWMAGQSFVPFWSYFNYRDFGQNGDGSWNWYGLTRMGSPEIGGSGTKKPGYFTLQQKNDQYGTTAPLVTKPDGSGSGGGTGGGGGGGGGGALKQIQLDSNGNLTNIDPSTARIHVALSATATSAPTFPGSSVGGDMIAPGGTTYPWTSSPFPTNYRSPDANNPWVAVEAWDQNGTPIGVFTAPVNLPPLTGGGVPIALERERPDPEHPGRHRPGQHGGLGRRHRHQPRLVDDPAHARHQHHDGQRQRGLPGHDHLGARAGRCGGRQARGRGRVLEGHTARLSGADELPCGLRRDRPPGLPERQPRRQRAPHDPRQAGGRHRGLRRPLRLPGTPGAGVHREGLVRGRRREPARHLPDQRDRADVRRWRPRPGC